MALTASCDIYASVNEAGINRVVRQAMRQRPSLFNYGTLLFLRRPDLLCREIDAHPVVLARGNPLISVEPPIPIVGTNGMYALDFCVQVPELEMDFSPGNVIALPPELSPPLAAQRLALHAMLCAGLGCPSDDIVAKLPPVIGNADLSLTHRKELPPGGREQPFVIPFEDLNCFCLDLIAVAGGTVTGVAPNQLLLAKLMGLEIVDIKPEGLENSIECYARLVLKLVVLPQLSLHPIKFAQGITGLMTATLFPSPVPAKVPNNPALEDDQLKVFVDLAVGPPPSPGPPGPPGPPSPPPLVGAVRPRTRTGAFDGTAAVSANAVGVMFEAVRDNFTFSNSGGGSFGPFSINYSVGAHLENGTVELRNDNTIRIREMDVKWDALQVCFGINIPEICVGGFCLVPRLWPPWGCLVEAPKICAFSANPDISFCLDIGGLITSEISAAVSPLTKYAVNPGRLPGWNDWDARDAGVPNKWQLLVDPVTIDLDVFDIADMVGDLFESAVDLAIDGLLGFLPGWAKDLIKAIMGPVVDLVRTILDFGDDFEEWLSDKLGVSLGLFNFLVTAVADYFASQKPLVEFDDPVQFMGPEGTLIPVLIPVEYLGVSVNADEMTIQSDLGG